VYFAPGTCVDPLSRATLGLIETSDSVKKLLTDPRQIFPATRIGSGRGVRSLREV